MPPTRRWPERGLLALALAAGAGPAPGWSNAEAPHGAGTALRFFGNGAFEQNQVKVRIDAPAVPADVGPGDFTLEFWIKALPGANPAGPCNAGGSGWIYGDIAFDRDVFGNGDHGDYGVSIADGRVAWGVGGADGAGYFENTICGSRVVADGVWHHVAVTRSAATALLRVFVDGQLDAEGPGPDGNASYRDGRATSYPTSDPFLVIGAEKHFGATGWNGFSGWIEEVRLSDVVRYTATFTRPTAPFSPDAATRALYHFDEGAGDVIGDSSAASGGPSPGVRHFGGSPAGPEWVASDAPIAVGPVLPGPELVHGAILRRDLAGGTADHYRISQPPLSSFEVLVDETGGDAGLVLERLASDGSTVLETAAAVGAGPARRLRWTNTLASVVDTQYVRVRASRCGSACGADDAYRLRSYDTTGRLARYNNTGGQATVVILQNPAPAALSGLIHFWRANGTLYTTQPFTLSPHGVLKLDTYAIPIYQDQAGHITVTHDGGYGGIAGKSAVVDPATGYSFDAPLVDRPR